MIWLTRLCVWCVSSLLLNDNKIHTLSVFTHKDIQKSMAKQHHHQNTFFNAFALCGHFLFWICQQLLHFVLFLIGKQRLRAFFRRYILPTKTHKRNVSAPTKKIVAANQDWRCKHCGCLLPAHFEVDHKVALMNGGTNEMDNLVALCSNCHAKKTMHERLK